MNNLFLSDKQAAARYGVGRGTIWRWIKKEDFPDAINLLIVDDEEGYVNVLANRFSRRNFRVVKAYSGSEGIQALRKQDFDVALLDLKMEALIAGGHTKRIKSAYKAMAKIYHPDVGGDTEKFKKLNDAHQQMLLWAQNPHFTSRKALVGCWSYDGYTNKWSPPL